MNQPADEFRKKEIDRVTELANIGAGHAAGAFAQLVGRTIRTEVPAIVDDAATNSRRPSDLSVGGSRDTWCTGVFFEFEGCLDAYVGILFPGAASEVLVRRIVGIESGDLAPSLIESALMEVGNILASHVASAIADTLGARLLPSIPMLAMEDAESRFGVWLDERVEESAPRIVCGFGDDEGELRGRLILTPA